VLERDGYRCTWVDDGTGERCTETEELVAAHVKPLRDFDDGDPAAYDPANGSTRCATHDVATDRYARRRRRRGSASPPPRAPLVG
jgi:hypothetical protein